MGGAKFLVVEKWTRKKNMKRWGHGYLIYRHGDNDLVTSLGLISLKPLPLLFAPSWRQHSSHGPFGDTWNLSFGDLWLFSLYHMHEGPGNTDLSHKSSWSKERQSSPTEQHRTLHTQTRTKSLLKGTCSNLSSESNIWLGYTRNKMAWVLLLFPFDFISESKRPCWQAKRGSQIPGVGVAGSSEPFSRAI